MDDIITYYWFKCRKCGRYVATYANPNLRTEFRFACENGGRCDFYNTGETTDHDELPDD